MRLKRIRLRNFRNLKDLEIYPNKNLNIIIGPNASGKTNLAEAICYAAKGLLLKGDRQREVIAWGQHYTLLELEIDENRLQISLYSKESCASKNGAEESKIIEVNSERKRQGHLVDLLQVTLFTPDDLQVIKGSPVLRRKFLDRSISELFLEYKLMIAEYEQYVHRKNLLLKKGAFDRDLLLVFNQKLLEKGAWCIWERLKYIKAINHYLSGMYKKLTGEARSQELKYDADLIVHNSLEEIKAELSSALAKRAKEEEQKGLSLVGPHRDDLAFYLNEIDMRRFGSQGEQKTCMIALKLAQLELYKERFGEYPILIMDDVLSELDSQRTKLLLENLPKDIQIFLTYTELSSFLRRVGGSLYRLEDGRIISEGP